PAIIAILLATSHLQSIRRHTREAEGTTDLSNERWIPLHEVIAHAVTADIRVTQPDESVAVATLQLHDQPLHHAPRWDVHEVDLPDVVLEQLILVLRHRRHGFFEPFRGMWR